MQRFIFCFDFRCCGGGGCTDSGGRVRVSDEIGFIFQKLRIGSTCEKLDSPLSNHSNL